MINVCTNDEKILKGISIVEKYIHVDFSKDIMPVKTDMDGYLVDNKEDSAIIYYGEVNDFYCGLATLLVSNKVGSFAAKRTIKTLGVMYDCARNGVPNIESLKREVVTLVLTGYNCLGLYMEDCFEVDGEPKFGYMRGRFTQNEIRELVEFADIFGVEIMPFIQTLAHLARVFHHWNYYSTIRDTKDILLMGEPKTYELLEHVISSVAKCFKTKRINIGMDEAFLMTLGKYREEHGECDTVEVFAKHVTKVCEICDKYGFKPEAWSDMFTKYAEKIKVPDNLSLVYWDYYNMDEKKYEEGIKKAQIITDRIVCAGGAWKWVGYAPLNEMTDCNTIPFLNVVKKTGVTSFFMTAWGDDGAECSYNAVLSSLINMANLAFEKKSKGILNKKAKLITGYTLDELYALDLPNKVFEGKFERVINPSKYALYEDPFYGIVDLKIGSQVIPYYEKNYKVLSKLSKRKSEYNYLFDSMAKLCNVLMLKADLRDRLIPLYIAGNKAEIGRIAKEEMPKTIKRLEAFIDAEIYQWTKENKVFGLEVIQIRLGGVLTRLKYIKNTLLLWSEGKIEKIPELEEKDLSEVHNINEYNGQSGFTNYALNVSYCDLASTFI